MSLKIKITRDFDIECDGKDLHSILKNGYYRHAEHGSIPIPTHAKIQALIPEAKVIDLKEVSIHAMRFKITWGETEEA